MNNLSIRYFKGFGEKGIELFLEGNSLLVCGENGSGKTSLFEALKWIFFHNQIVSNIPATVREEQRLLMIEDIKDEFNHKKYRKPFEILVDGVDYESFDSVPYSVYMVPSSSANARDCMELQSISRDIIMHEFDFDSFMATNREFLEEYINVCLKEDFKEDIKISISAISPYRCTIEDPDRNISIDKYLPKFFNEAKLRIINLITILGIINFQYKKDKSNILVVDDVLGSIDVANRSIFIKFLYGHFSPDYRVFFFTHNTSIFNTIVYYNNNIVPQKKQFKWKTYHLFDSQIEPIIYQYPVVCDSKALSELLKQHPSAGMSLDDIGNKIRKSFEELVHQFAHLLIIGAREETCNVIQQLSIKNYIYYNANGKTAYDLVNQIESIIDSTDHAHIIKAIAKAINDYKQNNDLLRSWLKDIVLMQKIALHPMSHRTGMVNYTVKELNLAIGIIEKLENTIKKLTLQADLTTT